MGRIQQRQDASFVPFDLEAETAMTIELGLYDQRIRAKLHAVVVDRQSRMAAMPYRPFAPALLKNNLERTTAEAGAAP